MAAKTAKKPAKTKTIFTFLRKINQKHAAFVLGILLIGIVLYYYRGIFVAALVNGRPISRISVIRELEKQSGKQFLESLVDEVLIKQEAQKSGTSISQQEIDEELLKIEENLKEFGQTLDQALAFQGLSKEDLVKQIEFQKLIDKLLGEDIELTDEEVSEFIERNKSFIENPESAEAKEEAKLQLKQQKLNEKFQTWIEEIRGASDIQYFVDY